MERPGLTKIGINRCEKLRWKGMFIQAEWDPTIQHSNDRSFWCQHTWNCLGPALVALGAKIKLVSAKGPREVPAASFFVTPQNETSREIALRPDEILTEILIPAGAVRSATYEVRQKEALDWPLATASVVLHMRGNVVASAKVVLGHVAAKPWDSAEAAKAIAGKAITADTAEAAGKAAVASAQPLSQNAYKVTLARVAVKRALLEAAKQKA